MRTFTTEIDIAAPPEDVWAALVDLPRYQEWNPFVVRAQGVVEQGGRLRLYMTPPGGRGFTLKPRVTVVAPREVLEWLGRTGGVPGLFSGRHRFELQAADEGTHLVQREWFTGLLVPLLARSLHAHTFSGLVAMNEALKHRSEQGALAG